MAKIVGMFSIAIYHDFDDDHWAFVSVQSSKKEKGSAIEE